VSQVCGLGPRVGGHLALFCIHHMNRVYSALVVVVTSWTCYGAYKLSYHYFFKLGTKSWEFKNYVSKLIFNIITIRASKTIRANKSTGTTTRTDSTTILTVWYFYH